MTDDQAADAQPQGRRRDLGLSCTYAYVLGTSGGGSHERYLVHYGAVGALAKARWYGSLFLKQAAAVLPAMAGELAAAAECCVAEHDLMWAVWESAGGNGVSDAHERKLADPGVRRRIIPLIRLARKEDAEAAAHVERALQLG